MERFKFQGSRVRSTTLLLSTVQAIKKVREGAQAYLAYVQAKLEVWTKLENILVVCNYPDVLSEVTELPLDREVEFPIDLMPGIQPIHRHPTVWLRQSFCALCSSTVQATGDSHLSYLAGDVKPSSTALCPSHTAAAHSYYDTPADTDSEFPYMAVTNADQLYSSRGES
jgi:hypothetical protein